ncbi:hypothetical protein SDC9_62421 [bioreactor metagenome]|uniref:Uncharacterized protein n=1 Tax=bioreactor metagenome TaxID=1076179 RepID=A0A644XJA4_9ZZZZ
MAANLSSEGRTNFPAAFSKRSVLFCQAVLKSVKTTPFSTNPFSKEAFTPSGDKISSPPCTASVTGKSKDCGIGATSSVHLSKSRSFTTSSGRRSVRRQASSVWLGKGSLLNSSQASFLNANSGPHIFENAGSNPNFFSTGLMSRLDRVTITGFAVMFTVSFMFIRPILPSVIGSTDSFQPHIPSAALLRTVR